MAEPTKEIDPTAPEPPLLSFLRDYWFQQRGQRAMPRRADIQPGDMKSHLPHIMMLDVVGGGQDFRYRLVGSRLQDYFKGNPTGNLMSEVLAPFGRETIKQTVETYRAVVAGGVPLRVRGSGSYYAQGAKVFDAMLMPLSDDGIAVNMILGGFTFFWDLAPARSSETDSIALENLLTARG